MVTKDEEAALADAIKAATKTKKARITIGNPPIPKVTPPDVLMEESSGRSSAKVPPHRTPAWWPEPFKVLTYIALSDSYVWCDEHAEIHGAHRDVYQDGSELCGPMNWRAVFVATDDPDEEF